MVRPIIFILGESGKYPRYEAAIRMAGGEVLAETCWKDAGRCDALLLPGGGDLEPWRYGEANTASRNLDPVRDQQEYLLMQQFAVLRRPILGICRGLQTINVYFGGSLLQDIPGHSTVETSTDFTVCGQYRRCCGSCMGRKELSTAPITRRQGDWEQACGSFNGHRMERWRRCSIRRFRCGPFNGIRSVWLRDRRELQTAGSCFRHFYSLLGKNEKKNEFTA